MSDRDELQALRRLAELEAKANGTTYAPAPAGPDLTSPEFKAKVKAQQDADRAQYDPLNDMSWGQRIAASAGAGLTDLAQGAKQRIYGAIGTKAMQSDVAQEVADKRALDNRLVQSTTGGGIARGVGTAAPMLLIPGGQGLAARSVIGSATGALAGALMPTTQGESSLRNTLVGGAFGGTFPLAAAAVGKMAKGGYNLVRNAVSRKAAQEAAAADIAGQLAGQGASKQATAQAAEQAAQELEQAAQAGAHAGPGGIPLSAAAATKNEALAQAERVARMRDPATWARLDEATQRAIAQKVKSGTAAAAEAGARADLRSQAYELAKQEALDNMDPEQFAALRTGLREGIEAAKRTPEGAINKSVRAALNEIGDQMDALGDDFGPEHLMEVRKNLSASLYDKMGQTADPLKMAPRDARPIRDIKGNIDAVLNAASGDRWGQANMAYRNMSPHVKAAQAAQKVQDVFFDPETGLARRFAVDTAGEVPNITEQGLITAQNAGFDKRARESLLDPQAKEALAQSMEAIRRKNWTVQRLNKAATGGGGSATESNRLAVLQDKLLAGAKTLGKNTYGVKHVLSAAEGLQGAGANKAAEATGAALQDPAALAALLRQYSSSVAKQDTAKAKALALLLQSPAVPAAGVQWFTRPDEQQPAY